MLLTSEKDGELYHLQWRSAATGEVVRTTKTIVDFEFLGAFDVDPAGDRVAAAWNNGRVRLLDARSGEILASIPTGGIGWVEDLAFSADGKSIVTGDQNMSVQSWSLDERRSLDLAPDSHPITHPKQVVRIALTGDGQHLAVGLWDGTICFWKKPEGPRVAYRIDAGGPTWPELSPDRRLLMPRGTSFREGTLRTTRAYDASTGAPAGPTLDPGGIVIDARFHADGARVAIAGLVARTPQERQGHLFLADGKSGNVQIWDWKAGKRLVGPVPMPAEPRGLAIRPDGKTLAVVCADYRVVLVDIDSGRIRKNLDPGIRTRPFNANLWTSNGEALFSPDGKFLLTWERVPTLHVWDPDDGRLARTLEHTERVDRSAFNPALPHILATSGRDSTAKVWDLNAGTLVAKLQHPRWVVAVEFSPDGSELISGCNDGLIRTWDWRTGALKRAAPLNDSLIDFAFTRDRRWLAAQGSSSFELTDWRSGLPAAPELLLPRTLNWGMKLPEGDRRAISGGYQGMLTAYDLEAMTTPTTAPVSDLVRLAEVASGRRIIDPGVVVAITSADWIEKWGQIQAAQAAQSARDAATSPPQPVRP